MSGGSFNYLCLKDGAEWLDFSTMESLVSMITHIEKIAPGSKALQDAKLLLSRIPEVEEQFNNIISPELKEVFHDVEWEQSGDYGAGRALEAIKAYDIKTAIPKTPDNGLDQNRILALLQEAVTAEPVKRLAQISIELREAVCRLDQSRPFEEGRQDALESVVNSLFYDTYNVNPALLPSLFPTFAMLCGKRDNAIFAKVDWSLEPIATRKFVRGKRVRIKSGFIAHRKAQDPSWYCFGLVSDLDEGVVTSDYPGGKNAQIYFNGTSAIIPYEWLESV